MNVAPMVDVRHEETRDHVLFFERGDLVAPHDLRVDRYGAAFRFCFRQDAQELICRGVTVDVR